MPPKKKTATSKSTPADSQAEGEVIDLDPEDVSEVRLGPPTKHQGLSLSHHTWSDDDMLSRYLICPPQLPNFKLALQTHFARSILRTARYQNQPPLTSPTSFLVRLGNPLDIALSASQYLFKFSSINCDRCLFFIGLLLMPLTTRRNGHPHERIITQLRLRPLVFEAIWTDFISKNILNLPNNVVGQQLCPL